MSPISPLLFLILCLLDGLNGEKLHPMKDVSTNMEMNVFLIRVSIDFVVLFIKIDVLRTNKPQGNGMISSSRTERTKEFVEFHLKRYFSKMGVSEGLSASQRYVDMCLFADVASGMAAAYSAIAESGKFSAADEYECSIERDVRFVIKILEKMSRSVPQEISPGMLLAHLELVEGMSVEFSFVSSVVSAA